MCYTFALRVLGINKFEPSCIRANNTKVKAVKTKKHKKIHKNYTLTSLSYHALVDKNPKNNKITIVIEP